MTLIQQLVLDRLSPYNVKLSAYDNAKYVLQKDFQLIVDLPTNRLCPRIPNRLYYIIWLNHILDDSSIVLDVGTGASAIYPLLGCKVNSSMKFVGTDIDPESIEIAVKNVVQNSLQDRIHLMLTRDTDPLIPHKVDAVICNPPFYDSLDSMKFQSNQKLQTPHDQLFASKNELITTGGELGFINRLVSESLKWTTEISWYTTLCGHKSTAYNLIEYLKSIGLNNIAITTIHFPSYRYKTKRWIIGWSFRDKRLPVHLSHDVQGSLSRLLPKNQLCIDKVISPGDLVKSCFHNVNNLNLLVNEDTIFVSAPGPVWNRAYRRNKILPMPENFEASISCTSHSVVIDWQRGSSYKTFESLYTFVQRSLRGYS
ncbi:hypothetical protein CANCADRAFT_78494 [Tortispora caseinolytica NRRL Y-17796]|uniref:Methyltransferase small domain-containing protein n=1 Tax=Tortispora caseinolytica NRRL Y-17796 TaxID=767744 RepID=A0A1E4TJB0_9ASCO|nr:hypothetical protein CANCADRAFT_78494 [Tortispora caseinolytica NRRL Y-17796]